MNVERYPYDRRRLDVLVAFSEANALSPVFSLPARRMIEALAAPGGVMELRSAGRTALVAVLVDGCDNVHDAAVLEILGWNKEIPLAPLLVAAETIGLGLKGTRACVSLALPEALADHVPPGWRPADASLVLERPVGPWETPTLPLGAAWQDLHISGVPEHYDVVRAAFAGDPSTFIPDLPTFAAACTGGEPPVRILRIDGVEVGFARASHEKGGIGYIASIGRDPAWRGRRLGPVVLAEALRILSVRRTPSRYRLGVTEANTAAVDLYRRFGFVQVERWQSWHRA